MAVNVLLSVGDGNVTDDFDLTTYVVEQGISAPPPEPFAKTRGVELVLDISAASADALWAAWGSIEQKLYQARRARGAFGLGTGVTLSLQLDTTNWVYFDILDGSLGMDTLGITLVNTYAVLSLVCLPYARGDAVTAGNLSTDPLSAWTLARATVDDDSVAAPNGAGMADTLLETSDNGSHELTTSIAKAASSLSYTLSASVKPVGRNVVSLGIKSADNSHGVYAFVDVSNGTVNFGPATFGSGFTADSLRIDSQAGGWYRVVFTVTSNAEASFIVFIETHNGSGTSYAGDPTKGLAIWDVTLLEQTTLTNGAASWLVENIPGDVPALARLTVEDVSTNGAVINGVHVYQRSVHGLTAGHFDPVVELTAATPGAADTDSSSYSGSDYARLASNTSWRTIAEATRPAGDYNNGLYDLWLRVRDGSLVPSAPRNLAADVNTGVVVTSIGGVSQASTSATIAVNTTMEVTSDHLLVLSVAATDRTRTISSITGIGGASWTLADDTTDNARVVHGTDESQVNQYWLRPVTTVAAGTTVTVTFSGTLAASGKFLQIAAITEMATSSPVDQVSADATTTAGTSIAPTLTTAAQDFEVLIATVNRDAGFNPSPTTTGFTNLYTAANFSAAGHAAYRIVTATGAYTATTTRAVNAEWTGTLVAYKAAATSGSSLTVGTWRLLVAAVGADGSLSPISDIIQARVVNSTDAIALTWDAPAAGTAATYRVYRDRGTGWGYFDTGSTATTYTWTTESGITAEDPNIDGSARGLFRVQVALDNGVTTFNGPSFAAELANNVWEDVLAGTFPLPPIPAMDGDDPPDWLIRVQGKHEEANPNLDVDIGWLVPHDEPQLIARSTGYELSTAVDWVIDQRRDGRVSGRLYENGTTTDAGQVDTIGTLTVGPGATQLAIRLTGEDGVSDVDDLKAIVTLRYVPRYRWLRGT